MAAVAREQGEAVQILGDGPLAQVAFSANAIRDQQGWLASNRARGRAVMLELLARGVFLNPMGTKLYLSLAHTDADIEDFVTRFAEAVRATSPAG
jgi:glutamate-1-semialdehyde 2,1-aminomutase